MKRIISIAIALVMMCALFSTWSSAEIYYQDSFDDFNGDFWIIEGTQFYVEGGVLEGFHDAVVQHSWYSNDAEGKITGSTTYDCFTLQFDARAVEPDSDGDHWIGIRFHDYVPFYNGDAVDPDVYYFIYNADTCTYQLQKNGKVKAEYKDPDNLGFTATESYKMGLKVELGKVTCYRDGSEIFSLESSTLGQGRTMLMFWNCGTYCQFDNVIVGDLTELPKKPAVPYDVNMDEKTNVKDAMAILKHIASWPDVLADEKAADCNEDGKINVKDVNVILRYIAEA